MSEDTRDEDDRKPTDMDLGDGVFARFTCWSPDRSIPANAERFAGVPDIERIGMVFWHPKRTAKQGGSCTMAGIYFDLPGVDKVVQNDRHRWKVESWEPLTLSPSILCTECGWHGFVRAGRWVPA